MKDGPSEWHLSYWGSNVAVFGVSKHPAFNLQQNGLMGIWDFRLAWEQLENIAEEKDLWGCPAQPSASDLNQKKQFKEIDGLLRPK